MKKGLIELVIIIDKSGSMNGLEKDVVGGFNVLIKNQKQQEGKTLVTTVFFDTTYEVIHKRCDVTKVNELTEKDYIPDGCTALLDAIGHSINHLKDTYKELDESEVPEHVIFSIMTDGMENSSREYSYSVVKKLIEKQKELGWEFIFQAANIDSVEEGKKLGINLGDIDSFEVNPDGVQLCFKSINKKINVKRKK